MDGQIGNEPVAQDGQIVQPRRKRNVEFTVGAVLFSLVGGGFILTALVLAGMNFMNDFVKGLSIFAGCLLVTALSEIILSSKLRWLGAIISVIGICGLYGSVMVNFLYYGNFGAWAAAGAVLLLTVCVIILSRIRNAVSYRILGMVAFYVCFLAFPVYTWWEQEGWTWIEFAAMTGMAAFVNLLCLVFPLRKARTALSILHLFLNTVFCFGVALFGPEKAEWPQFAQLWLYPTFVAASVFAMQLIFIRQVRWQGKKQPDKAGIGKVGICVMYVVAALCYLPIMAITTGFADWDPSAIIPGGYMMCRLIYSGAVFVLCVLPLLFLLGRKEKWLSWYLFSCLIVGIYWNTDFEWERAWAALALLVTVKLLSFAKISLLRPLDAILTTLAAVVVVWMREEQFVVPLFLALLFSILCINYWKTYFETVLTLAVALYTFHHMLYFLALPVFIGTLMMGMLLFNYVKRWRGKGISIYNGMMLAGQAAGCLLLLEPEYQNAYLTYLCVLIFEVSTIVVMDFRWKDLLLAVFLTYMALAARTDYAVTNSILLMFAAFVLVGVGFSRNKITIRIYGLLLSLVVCGKIVLYDFLEAPLLQKTILLFAVGVIALMISAIYMILERRAGKQRMRELPNVSVHKEQNV